VSTRYSLCASADELRERFSIDVPPAYGPRFNAAPGTLLPVVTNTGPGGLSFFYWGLAPLWAKEKPISEKISTIRSELVAEKSSYRKRLLQHRCLVPADGLYEWKKLGKKSLIPYRCTLPTKELFSLAALWEEYEDEQEQYHTFSILTLPVNDHPANDERRPVILSRENESYWLANGRTEEEYRSVLMTPPPVLVGYTVSHRIDSLTENDAGLIRPAPAADQFGNLTLFD
jgi:putative SOS response-associated peptidase YedK